MSWPRGLEIYPSYFSLEGTKVILNEIDNNYTWTNQLKRRVIHMGYEYDYKSRKLSPSNPISGILEDLKKQLRPLFGKEEITQIIVNEYTSGQCISKHTDANVFGPTIMTLTLGNSATLRFTRKDEVYDVLCSPGDLIIMRGESRTDWKHETLPIRNKDFRRVSITFRST